MPKLAIQAGATSKLLHVYIQDSTGTGITGLTAGSAGLKCAYLREGAANAVTVALVTATVGTYTSGGFIEVDATNLPGWYELGLPNAALAAGARSVVAMFAGAANMLPVPIEVALDGFDYANGYIASRPWALSVGTGPGGKDQLIEYQADGVTTFKAWTLTKDGNGNYSSRA